MSVKGMGLALIGALLFGAVTGLSKLLLASAGPATVGALTYLGAGLVGCLAAALSQAPPAPAAGRRGGWSFFIAALILGAMAAPLLLMTGLQWTTASMASVLANIEGIATAALAWLLFREKSDAISIVCIIAILGGVVCFTLSEDIVMSGSVGPLLVGTAYACWALDINLMRRVPIVTPAQATLIRGIGGALAMAVVAWLCREPLPDGATAVKGLLIGAVGFGASFILLLKALPVIGTAQSGAVFASAPIFSYPCSALIERSALQPSAMQLAAFVLIAFGILLSGANTFRGGRSASKMTSIATRTAPRPGKSCVPRASAASCR